MPTLTPYADERLLVLRRLRAESQGAPLAEYFRPTGAELRFRLGTALADLRIPFRFGAELVRIASVAATDAWLLGANRHRPILSPDESVRVGRLPGFEGATPRPIAYAPPSSITRPALLRTFHDGPIAHAGIDAGLLASFLGTDRAGRRLLVALHALFTKAREESRRSSEGEPTPYLVALALRVLAERLVGLMREAPVSEGSGRWLRGLASVLLHEVTALALRETNVTRDAGLVRTAGQPPLAVPPREARSALLSVASLGLAPFVGSRGAVLQTGVGAYGLLFDAVPPRVEELVARLAQGDDAEQLARDAAQLYGKERDVSRRLERATAFFAIRENVRALARLNDAGRAPTLPLADASLQKLASPRDGVEKAFASPDKRKALAQAARDAGRQSSHEESRERYEALAHAAREFRDDEPAAWLGTAEARQAAARAIVAFAADQLIERHAAQATQLLLERTGAETEGGGEAEYESGRVYLVSHEEGPLLNTRVGPPQVGHLFCDMKDFTRRTAFLKESIIADFLQREFYQPILSAASGMESRDRSGRALALNNLLGDAVSFSGDIAQLMRLNRGIREILRSYGKRLEAESSQSAVSVRVRELESQHRARRDALERSIRELKARAPTADPGLRDTMLLRARELESELDRRQAQYESELSRAAGEKLEAGTFISFGAAPEVARFEDPAFGQIKVAIAEKINESARGTARSGAVRDLVLARLDRERRATGLPLELPFHVLVDQPASVPVPAERAVVLQELLAKGDTVAARTLLDELVLRMLKPAQTPGELYNAGSAISEDALEAWLDTRGEESKVLRLELPIAQLHEELRRRMFFPRATLQLVACASAQSHRMLDLFVFQGRVLFRGFEASGGLGVWEIVDAGSPLFQLIAAHHAPDWFGTAPAL